MGNVLQFPHPPARTCYDCQHVFLGSTGSWCGQYEVRIWTETEAEECEEYSPFESAETGNGTEDQD